MIPGPVFQVELLTLSRRARYYALRFAYGLLLLFLIVSNAPYRYRPYDQPYPQEITIQEMANLGRSIFASFAWSQAIVVILAAPALAAGVIVDEKQRKTLDYLLASTLTSGEIVLGKLCARLLLLGVFVSAGLPILSMLGFLGGVDPNDVFLFMAATTTTGFFLASLSMLVSVHARKTREAVTLAYMIVGIWLFAPSLFELLRVAGAAGYWREVLYYLAPANFAVGISSPLYAFMFASGFGPGAARYEYAYYLMASQVAYGTVFLAVAVMRLRPLFRGGRARKGVISRTLGLRRLQLLPRPACGDDPMIWKEVFVSRTGLAAQVVGFFMLATIGALIGYGVYQFAKPALIELVANGYARNGGTYYARGELNAFLRVMLCLVYTGWAIGLANTASTCLTSEREEDTWISLIATPLRPVEIIRAKMIGAFWAMRWFAALWSCLLLVGLLLGAIHPIGLIASLIVHAVFLYFACVLGVFYSLRSRTSMRAIGATVATLLFLNGLYLIGMFPLFAWQNSGSVVIFLGVTPFVEVLSNMSYADVGWIAGDIGNSFRRNQNELLNLVVAGFLSVACYAAGGLALTMHVLFQFDEVLDRPSSDGGPPLPGLAVKPPAESTPDE